MASIEQIKASDGSGNADLATIQNTRSPGASTIIVDTVLGINPDSFAGTMGTPHTFTDPITSETITVISDATAVDFTGHVDGSNLEIDDIAPGYTDGGSAVGDIVIIRPTTQWGDNVADVLAVSHNDNGTLKSNIVTTAKIGDDQVTAPKVVGIDKANLTTDSNPYKFFAYLNAIANLTASAQRLQFEAEVYDTNNNFDITTNIGRYTAPVTGFYHFHAQDYINVLADQAQMFIGFYKNGTNFASSNNGASGTNDTACQISIDMMLTAGDYVEVFVSNSQGTRDHLGLSSGRYLSYFSGFLISRT